MGGGLAFAVGTRNGDDIFKFSFEGRKKSFGSFKLALKILLAKIVP